MHVVFGDIGQLVIHDVREGFDIETAGGDIRRDEDAHGTLFKLGKGAGAGSLALVAMDGGGGDAVVFELLGEAVGPVFGTGEDEDLAPVSFVDELGEEPALVGFRDRVHRLGDELGSFVAPGNGHFHRIVEKRGSELPDLIRIGGGEEQVLPFSWKEGDDFLDVVDKPHVEHAVGLIENEDFHLRKIHRALPRVVEQTTGRSDKDIHPLAETADLGIDAHATENHR